MKEWPAPGLASLVHELYKLSEENRRFLHARLLAKASAETLASTKRQLERLLSRSAVLNGRFRHVEIKRLIDQYAKATDDPTAMADLLVTDLEMAFATFREVGDFEPIVDHLYSTLHRLDKIIPEIPTNPLELLVHRINELAARWGASFGYGISDELVAFASELRQRVGTTENEP